MTRSFLIAVFGVMASVSPAFADESVLSPQQESFEAGVYGGGFISNKHHQFYDIRVPNRPLLDTVNPEWGLRGAYFLRPWLGIEGEASWILAHTTPEGDPASIFGARIQVIVQSHLIRTSSGLGYRLFPFVGAGIGVDHVSSPMTVLGSDTDFPIHVEGGARLFITSAIALRADLRLLRGPSQQAPYTLNASYGEFMFGVSFVPGVRRSGGSLVETDRDGDGIPDSRDKCPNEAEDKDGFQDDDGCPDPDNDKDGIPDAVDKCPNEAEDKDGFMDEDGCPESDNDADGILDGRDMCPNVAEDKDGFQDDDGCPELDNDHDGIPDAQDKCPNEPETINGFEDEDGCPDNGGMSVVVLSSDRLELLEPITFTGAKVAKSSINVLGQIGATLRAHDEIKRVRITVHVQPSRDAQKDQDVSDWRAAAVRDWLVTYGIAANRVEPRGFGGTKPLVAPNSRGAAAINERVDLIILERK